jgi:uncharacterized protein DUF6916
LLALDDSLFAPGDHIMMERREFLIGSCGAMVLACLGAGKALASGVATVDASAGVGMAKWEALLNQDFRLWLSGRNSLVLRLVAVKGISTASHATQQTEQFSLLFTGDASEPLADGSYEVNTIVQPAEANYFLHLQPAGTDSSRALYRSDFNLLK